MLRKSRRKAFLLAIFLAAVLASIQADPQSPLGAVHFQTSASPAAQAHFLRGLAALHSFWFEEALDAFRASTRIDPDFAMGYWGEAMAHNHPLWAEQDTDAARAVLARVPSTPKLTPRERAYLNAVRVLYGDGDKLARDRAYAAAMEQIVREYPDDDEAACLSALALLGQVRPGDRGYQRQMRAGAIALDVYRRNPDHPGAAHYIIHAFDDPEHAILALPAARRYASIAPEASHARHMPAHIFLQLGMWPEAAASNESAWAASNAWVSEKALAPGLRDYHSLQWLLYVYVQQGRYKEAEGLIAVKRAHMGEEAENGRRPGGEPANAPAVGRYYEQMAAAFVVETGRWELADRLFPPPAVSGGHASDRQTAVAHGGHYADPQVGGAGPVAGTTAATRNRRSQTLPLFVRGLAAAEMGAMNVAERCIADLRAIRERGQSQDTPLAEIMELEVDAEVRSLKGRHEEAVELMTRAVAIEERMSPPSGPPDVIKPSHEHFGDILLRAGRPKDASTQFATALLRQPNRARSLLGSARAAARSGDRSAAERAYARLLDIWRHADAGLPALQEAREYLGQVSRASVVPPK